MNSLYSSAIQHTKFELASVTRVVLLHLRMPLQTTTTGQNSTFFIIYIFYKHSCPMAQDT